MANSADPDQLASSESTLFAKQGISGFSRTRVKVSLKGGFSRTRVKVSLKGGSLTQVSLYHIILF